MSMIAHHERLTPLAVYSDLAIVNAVDVNGGIAQLVERLVRNEKARGSNPLTSSLRSPRSGERRLSRRSFSEGGQF